MSAPRIVAFGGGHGLAASLSALRQLTDDVTAVVTVADDGGSSGRLRRQFPGLLPPGDLRMAMAALAGQEQRHRMWRDVVQHRFGGDGDVGGHTAGNVMLAALAQVTDDPVAALDAVADLLGVRGRVLPMAAEPLNIVADVVGAEGAPAGAVTQVRGQHAVARTSGQVVSLRLEPPVPSAYPAVLEAVMAADWLVFGPGSWFTSVLPHLLVPDLAKTIEASPARRLLALNLAPQVGETTGFLPESYLDVFCAYAPDTDVDVVLADSSSLPDDAAVRRLEDVARDLGARLVVGSLRVADGQPHHDADRLCEAYRDIFSTDVPDDGGDSAWR